MLWLTFSPGHIGNVHIIFPQYLNLPRQISYLTEDEMKRQLQASPHAPELYCIDRHRLDCPTYFNCHTNFREKVFTI